MLDQPNIPLTETYTNPAISKQRLFASNSESSPRDSFAPPSLLIHHSILPDTRASSLETSQIELWPVWHDSNTPDPAAFTLDDHPVSFFHLSSMTSSVSQAREPPKRPRGRPRKDDEQQQGGQQSQPPAKSRKKQQQQQQQQQQHLDPPEQIPTSSAAPGRRRPSTAGHDASPTTGTNSVASAKQERLRSRNRQAAQKCRQRKQQGIDKLQADEATVEAVHKALAEEASSLRGEVLVLKSMLLQHASCGVPFIERYIEGAASDIINGTSHGSVSSAGSEMQSPASAASGLGSFGAFPMTGCEEDGALGNESRPLNQSPEEPSTDWGTIGSPMDWTNYQPGSTGVMPGDGFTYETVQPSQVGPGGPEATMPMGISA